MCVVVNPELYLQKLHITPTVEKSSSEEGPPDNMSANCQAYHQVCGSFTKIMVSTKCNHYQRIQCYYGDRFSQVKKPSEKPFSVPNN